MRWKFKPIPEFANEAQERRFWESHDSADYVDWSEAEPVRLPNLRPSTTSISLCLSVSLLEQIRVAARKRDVPYQSLIKTWLAREARSWLMPTPLVHTAVGQRHTAVGQRRGCHMGHEKVPER